MRFYSLTQSDRTDKAELKRQYEAGHRIGAVCVGQDFLFVKKRLKTYFIAYADTERIFRRVQTVHVNICCEQGDLQFDYLVISMDGKELVEAQLPGAKAAKLLMKELKETHPECDFAAPRRPVETAETEATA